MKLTGTPLAIPDVVLLEHEAFEDDRGYLMEAYQHEHFRALGLPERFVQINESLSARNVVRGLHFQWDPAMAKVMRVVSGAGFLVAVDIRHNSPTLGQWVGLTLSAKDKKQIWAPAGFARGICSLADDTRVQYLCTGTWNGATESGIAWDDPEIGVAWPVKNPHLSERDRRAQTLRQWLARPEAKKFSV